MAYVRKKGNQVAIVRGERDPATGKVSQRTLFTFYSKAEAYRAIGKGPTGKDVPNEGASFQRLLEDDYPEVKFDWPKIKEGILEHIDGLPDLAPSQERRLEENFRSAMHAFTRELVLADPLCNPSLIQIVDQKRRQLEFLADLLEMRLEQSRSLEEDPLWDNEFVWERSLRAPDVSPSVEEFATEFYRTGDYDSATAAFELLTECFPRYAEGHNYLGLIALNQENLDEAIRRFRLAVDVGRKNFPKRISQQHYWSDLNTRPYMRGLRNLTLALTRKGVYDEALTLCDVIERECGDAVTAACFRASIHLNRGEWKPAEEQARTAEKIFPFESIIGAFAQFEQGKIEQARSRFLFGALNHPLGIQTLLNTRVRKPRNYFETEDYNSGIETRDLILDYLNSRSPKSKGFFSSLLADKRVSKLMKEALECSVNHSKLTGPEHKANFARWEELRSYDFAKKVAPTLDD